MSCFFFAFLNLDIRSHVSAWPVTPLARYIPVKQEEQEESVAVLQVMGEEHPETGVHAFFCEHVNPKTRKKKKEIICLLFSHVGLEEIIFLVRSRKWHVWIKTKKAYVHRSPLLLQLSSIRRCRTGIVM